MKHAPIGALLFLLLLNVGGKAQDQPTERGQVSSKQMAINGVSLEDPRSRVVEMLGQPDSATAEFADIFDEMATTLYYAGLIVVLVGDRTYEVRCLQPTCATADGIRVGDLRSKVEAVYGPALHSPRLPTDHMTYVHAWKDCGLTFVLDGNKVVESRLWCDWA